MQLNYDSKKLSNIARDFYNATGANICILDKNFSPLIDAEFHCEYCKKIHNLKDGKLRCTASDYALLFKAKETKKAQMHICHAGLTDCAVPIFYENDIIGYILMGELKCEDNFSSVKSYIFSSGADMVQMEKCYRELPLYTSEKVQSITNVAIMLAKFILTEKMLRPDSGNKGNRIISYIDENLQSELSIHKICENANISKNVLYKFIHKEFGCTVSEYINKKRISFAQKLLESTDLSVEEISQKCGFASASYFTRTFRRQRGITPLKYRKNFSF